MDNNILIEVCTAHIQSAIAAQQGGAGRIELVGNLYEGGTTPSYATIKTAVEKLQIDIMVMIRPRGSDFCYSNLEFEIMKQDIRVCKDLGVHGVVFGILQSNGNIDQKRTRELVKFARPLKVTFHRAFDMTPDPYTALEEIIDCGVDRILTAGHQNTVPEGLDLIKKIVELADSRIKIMPGSGIHEENIKGIRDFTGAREFHLTARVPVDSEMAFRKEHIFMGGLPQIPEYKIFITSPKRVRKIVTLVNEY